MVQYARLGLEVHSISSCLVMEDSPDWSTFVFYTWTDKCWVFSHFSVDNTPDASFADDGLSDIEERESLDGSSVGASTFAMDEAPASGFRGFGMGDFRPPDEGQGTWKRRAPNHKTEDDHGRHAHCWPMNVQRSRSLPHFHNSRKFRTT